MFEKLVYYFKKSLEELNKITFYYATIILIRLPNKLNSQ